MLSGCGSRKEDRGADYSHKEDTYAKASLFCDVNFWEPPSWSTEEGTITGDITRATGLALDITVPPQNADAQLSLMLLDDQLPDIISVTDRTVMSQLISSGKVWNMAEFLGRYSPDSQLLKRFPDDIKNELIKRDGGWYAITSHINSEDAQKTWEPNSDFYREWTTYSENNGIVWNRSLLQKAGLVPEELQTEEQVMDAWEKVKNMHLETEQGEVIPLLVDGKDYIDPTIKYLEYTFGAERIDAEGNFCDILMQPQSEHALLFLNEAIRKGYADPEQLTYENTQIKSLLAEGRVLCFIGNLANTNIDYTEWVSTGPILSSDGSVPVLGKNLKAPTGWLNTFISKSCKKPKEIAAWLEYMTSDEGLLFWNYGREGQDYYLDGQGHVVQTEAGKEASQNYSQTGQGAWWMFENFSWKRNMMAEPEENTKERAEKEIFTAYAIYEDTVIYDESLLPLKLEDSSFDEDMGALEDSIKAYEEGQIPRIILAESSQEARERYRQMKDKVKAMGLDKLTAYKNQIYQSRCEESGEKITKVNGG